MEFLAEVPLDATIRESSDEGAPIVVRDPDGEVAAIYTNIARRIMEKTRSFRDVR